MADRLRRLRGVRANQWRRRWRRIAVDRRRCRSLPAFHAHGRVKARGLGLACAPCTSSVRGHGASKPAGNHPGQQKPAIQQPRSGMTTAPPRSTAATRRVPLNPQRTLISRAAGRHRVRRAHKQSLRCRSPRADTGTVPSHSNFANFASRASRSPGADASTFYYVRLCSSGPRRTIWWHPTKMRLHVSVVL